MSDIKLELKKKFMAPAEAVYDAWLDPKSVKTWMCPAEGVTVPTPEIDPRVGGKFQFDMKIGDTVTLPHFGEYKSLDKPRMIQFTWNSPNTGSSETLVTVTIDSIDSQSCELSLLHELLPSEASKNDHNGGWNNILSSLDSKIRKS